VLFFIFRAQNYEKIWKYQRILQKNLIFYFLFAIFFVPLHPEMCSQETYTIDLKGLTEDLTVRDFNLDDEFFRALDGSQLEHGALHVSVSIRKMTGFFDLQFHTVGSVTISCDRCLDDMDQPIETDNHFVVKLGDTYSEDDDTVIVDENEGMLDLSWFIYEFIMLAIPIKHVHAPGKCNSAMTQKLEELSGAVRSGEEGAEAIDPRWSALLKLKK
jgi:uncharacterized metal-binding protein YceD (DUF177 family)